MTAKRPTLKTISELSGFAVPTVSRALKDAPDIGEKTKQTVRRIAAEVGYVPNRAGVRLRTGKTNVISIVLSTEVDSIDDHTGRLIASIAQTLRTTPYHMIVTPYTKNEDRLDPVRYIVETRSADAIIMNQIEHEDPRISYLMERNFPFVTYGRTRWCREHAYFDFDNRAFGEIAANRLLRNGRRAFLLIAPPRDQSYSLHMIDGAKAALSAKGLELEILKGVDSHAPNALMRAGLAERLVSGPPVDAIVAPSTISAIAAVAALEHVGLTLGKEIDVFAKESAPLLCFFRREVMTVHEDVISAGEFLAKAGIRAIERPDLAPMQALEVARESRPAESLF
ncbi:LacI family transcriptional regulator [Aliiruegeria haliotis]|uniref:LacI family transcriptional regulator n=1 Tax=Aliiruegeria haliotis TaxID=1280846 RepID=A0A2T0RRI0_9RHOB|nr:LacI family transcriptional regulator [Aliiruegeria haliotis]PRY23710.1 LacI family transcriptional regulator [Aliiruegeria haliotis]